MRALALLLVVFLLVSPATSLFAADETTQEPEENIPEALGENTPDAEHPPLEYGAPPPDEEQLDTFNAPLLNEGFETLDTDEESFITLPVNYDAERNTYYFSGLSEYCTTATVEWHVSAYPEDSSLVARSVFDCEQQDTIDLYDAGGWPLSRDGERSISIENGEHRYILRYSVENDVLLSAGSPPFPLDTPFTPVRDAEAEHRLLSATVENGILKVDASVCELMLSSIGGMSQMNEPWAFDRALWLVTKSPAESSPYGPDNWPSIGDASHLYTMVEGASSNASGNTMCYGEGVPEYAYYFDYWDLEASILPNPIDGEMKFFVWGATKNRPGHNGEALRSNARPIGYISATRVDGIWYLTADAPLPPPEVSNVMFLAGIKSSRLYDENGERLWIPLGDEETRMLYLNSGNSVYAHQGDILDSYFTNDYYASFISDMDALVAEDDIADWEAVAYDWRLSLSDIVTNGAESDGRISYTSATSSPYMEQTLKRLVSSSKSGKVTIVAHSNGGLVAKALLQRIEDEYGEEEVSRLVDKVILVGVPQSGAPRSIGGLLFGYGEALPLDSCAESFFSTLCSLLTSRDVAREFAELSPMAYHLLPSQAYFDSEDDQEHPIISFKHGNHAYAEQNQMFGETIEDFNELAAFLRGDDGRTKPEASDVASPNILDSSLLEYAHNQHDVLDVWTPPAGVKVYQIAGWGDDDTVAGIKFFEGKSLFGGYKKLYEPIFTEDGDGVVPIPSALLMTEATNVSRYWVNLDQYEAVSNLASRDHADILEIPELRLFLSEIIRDRPEDLPEFIVDEQPSPTNEEKKLRFLLHSPLAMSLYDEFGNHTGQTEGGESNQYIEGSTYGEFGEVKYITVPAGLQYTLILEGEENGEFSLKIDEIDGGTVEKSSIIEAIPTSAETYAFLTIENGVRDASPLEVDIEDDWVTDFTVEFREGETVTYGSWEELEENQEEEIVTDSGEQTMGWSRGRKQIAEIRTRGQFVDVAHNSPGAAAEGDIPESQAELIVKVDSASSTSDYLDAQSASAYSALSQQEWLRNIMHAVYSWITALYDLLKWFLVSIMSFLKKII